VVVSLNPDPAQMPDPATVLGEFHYSHPVFDGAAVQAQQRLGEIQGRSGLWFCGAWTRYGFHEDGLTSGLNVVQALSERWLRDGAPRAAA
jgi:predicted NAD/FAD-binding protein